MYTKFYVTYTCLLLIYLTCIILFLILSSKFPSISGLFLARIPPTADTAVPAFEEEESKGSDRGGSTDPPTIIQV